MKLKDYISPRMITVVLRTGHMVALSFDTVDSNQAERGTEQLIKEDVNYSNSYNVWDDDWSK